MNLFDTKFSSQYNELTPMTKNSRILPGQSGQATVIILLIMVVVLTIGLSITARSITDLRISSQTEQSNRAFSAAEAGIEEALKTGLQNLVGSGPSGQKPIGGATYKYTVESVGGASYAPDKPVAQDDVVQLKLDKTGLTSAYDGVNIYWIASGEDCDITSGNPAAVEVSIIYGDGPYNMYKQTYAVKDRGDNFLQITAGSFTLGSKTYCARTPTSGNGSLINFNSSGITNPQLLRIRPLYNTSSLAVEAQPSGRQLPIQSYRVRSEGEAGGVKRTVEVTQSVPVLPAIFDYVLFSGAGLTK